jgi:hypothetical protein
MKTYLLFLSMLFSLAAFSQQRNDSIYLLPHIGMSKAEALQAFARHDVTKVTNTGQRTQIYIASDPSFSCWLALDPRFGVFIELKEFKVPLKDVQDVRTHMEDYFVRLGYVGSPSEKTAGDFRKDFKCKSRGQATISYKKGTQKMTISYLPSQ